MPEIDFSQPFKPFVLTEPMHIGQDALTFKVVSLNDARGTVVLTDPSCSEDKLLKVQSDSDWIDWGDDFEMPEILFEMMFGVEPVVNMILVAPINR